MRDFILRCINIHKYWARKPDNIVAAYIERYSKEGDTVLDPFSGSGVTAIEALRLGRKAIAVDLDPVGNFIALMTALPVDIDSLQEAFDALKDDVKDEILKYFKTICPECGKSATIHSLIYANNKPTKIVYECNNPVCEHKGLKDLTNADRKTISTIEETDVPYWYPDNELIWNSRVNVSRGEKVSDLFSKRNLIALSILYNGINKIEDELNRNMIKFAFSAALPQASKLLVYTPGQGPGWKVRGFWIPANRYEMNVWRFFENKFKKLVSGKKESNKLLSSKYSKDAFKIFNHSATELNSIPELKENSVDYVFTDPPYGDSVPYLELNLIYASWLGFKSDLADEICISDSPLRRDKNNKAYYTHLAKAFREIYRVLKPGKYLTVTFNNTKMEIYNDIFRSAILAGFDSEKIVYQHPAKKSSKAQLAPYGSAFGDYYIRFRKPLEPRDTLKIKQPDEITFERVVIQAVKKIIAERGQPTEYSLIINSYSLIYDLLKKEGFLFSASQSIDDVLNKHMGEEFVLVNNKLWFANPSVVPYIDRVPLKERVEKVVISTLNREIKLGFDDILKEVYKMFPNSLTPETTTINEVLEDYAEKTKDKKWILKQSVSIRMSQHNTMVDYLIKIGERFGYTVIADLEGYRVKELPFDNENPDRVREIDVIWLEGKTPKYEFEVENTTGISEVIDRGSNLDVDDLTRIIVIPEERKPLLNRKLHERKFNEEINKYGWQFMYYKDLDAFFVQMKGHKKPKISELKNSFKTPEDMRRDIQTELKL